MTTSTGMLDWDALAPDRHRGLRRVEYDQLIEAGVFADERLELLHGVLITISKQSPRHASIADELMRLLYVRALAAGVFDRISVRCHSPFAASEYSQPQVDVAVIAKRPFGSGHPNAAYLVIEVADGSLHRDREIKRGIYADNGVPEYWIVDVDAGSVEVYTDPHDGDYHKIMRAEPGETLRPIELPGVAIAVADILPAQGRTDTSA
jgi:Uma2 family endonuclease